MPDCGLIEDRDRCPTLDEVHDYVLALLPQGRAWSTREGGPYPDDMLWQFWRSVAAEIQYVETRICDLKREFVCGTAAELLPVWQADYGLPDDCDPYGDVCAKVAAEGGSRCEYFKTVAAAHGWSIDCIDIKDIGASCGCCEAGCVAAGEGVLPDQFVIVVTLADSPAYAGPSDVQPEAGCYEAGFPIVCIPGLDSLYCLLERIIPAHLETIYEVI